MRLDISVYVRKDATGRQLADFFSAAPLNRNIRIAMLR
jgi:hypothetical protein